MCVVYSCFATKNSKGPLRNHVILFYPIDLPLSPCNPTLSFDDLPSSPLKDYIMFQRYLTHIYGDMRAFYATFCHLEPIILFYPSRRYFCSHYLCFSFKHWIFTGIDIGVLGFFPYIQWLNQLNPPSCKPM